MFLELNREQLDVIARVLGPECSAVKLTAEHQTGSIMKYFIVLPDKAPPNIKHMYGIEIPAKRRVGIYLTEAQRQQLKCAGIVEQCDYVEVEAIGLKYGIVVPTTMRYGIPPPSKT
jgi:hypothetical protein